MVRHHFKVHTPNLLKEIVEANPTLWSLAIPIDQLRQGLARVAQRAIEINDPEMNRLMLMLTLYSAADPSDPDFDPALVAGITEVPETAEA